MAYRITADYPWLKSYTKDIKLGRIHVEAIREFSSNARWGTLIIDPFHATLRLRPTSFSFGCHDIFEVTLGNAWD